MKISYYTVTLQPIRIFVERKEMKVLRFGSMIFGALLLISACGGGGGADPSGFKSIPSNMTVGSGN